MHRKTVVAFRATGLKDSGLDGKQRVDGKVIWENIEHNIGSGLKVTTGEFIARVEYINSYIIT